MLGARRDDHLVYIGVDYQVGIVSNDDDLPSQACRPKQINQLSEDRLRVEVLFRLIDDQWARVLQVKSKVEQQKHDSRVPGDSWVIETPSYSML